MLYVLLYAAREPRKRAEQLRVTPNDERVRAPRSDFETIETKSMTHAKITCFATVKPSGEACAGPGRSI